MLRFLRRELPALIASLSLLITGVVGYRVLEGMEPLDALYMTVITISTVGFAEVRPLSWGGRLFTIGLIVTGAAVAAYFIGVAGQLFLEGSWRARWEDSWRQRMLGKLRNHAIVCGYGRVGRHVVEELVAEGIPYVVIEPDPDVGEEIGRGDGPCVPGDATDEAVLRDAGIERAKYLVAALSSDANNVFIALTARSLNPSLTIAARANSDTSEAKLVRAGADQVIVPYRLGAHRLVTRMLRPGVADFLDEVMRAGSLELLLEQLDLPDGSPLLGKTLAEAEIRQRAGVTVLACALPREGLVTAPGPQTVLNPGARLIVLGTRDQLTKLDEITKNG